MSIFWYETHDNVTALGAWLIAERDFSVAQLQWYYEKPWHWTPEWNKYQQSKVTA